MSIIEAIMQIKKIINPKRHELRNIMNLEILPVQQDIHADLDILASDKSLSHRVCMFSLFADSTCRIKHFLRAEDTQRSLTIAQSLGLHVSEENGDLLLTPPKKGLQTPSDILYCGNSGTSMRLFTGLLAGANLYAVLCGDVYLHARPMGRILKPLRTIGANIASRTIQSQDSTKEVAPLCVIPSTQSLKGFTYHSQIASAQVKSALILAALQGNEESVFSECELSRDHTENMLYALQKKPYLQNKDDKLYITPFSAFGIQNAPLKAFDVSIPNDPSSAFFFAVLASILPNTSITLRRVMINKTRIEAFRILEKMGAKIRYENISNDYEKTADITISSAELQAITIEENIAWLIDEIPALSIACSVAKGTSKIRNAAELRVKESDRISVVLQGLKNFGIQTIEYSDGFDIIGGSLQKCVVDSKGDHRIAMSFAIAACVCGGTILDSECIHTSFPNFIELLSRFTTIHKTHTHV